MWFVFAFLACSTPTPAPPPAPAPVVEAPAAPVEAPARPAPGRVPASRAPVIDLVTITPAAPVASDSLKAEVTMSTAAGANIDLDYTWFINDAPVIGVASERLGGRFKKGDVVRVRVVADNGGAEADGESAPVTIANRPPVFETGPTDMRKVDGFTFRATDPDEDPLTWRLENAPKGMRISPKGVLAYTGAEDEPGGSYTVAVVVEDGEAFGRYEFPLTVTPGSKAKAAAAAPK